MLYININEITYFFYVSLHVINKMNYIYTIYLVCSSFSLNRVDIYTYIRLIKKIIIKKFRD